MILKLEKKVCTENKLRLPQKFEIAIVPLP